MDSAQIMSSYRQWAAEMAGISHVSNPPEVELKRFVATSEWAQVQVDCMIQAGFSASANPQGGIEYADVPKEQGSALNLAAYVCQLQYPVDPRTHLALPRVRAEMQYDWLVSSVYPCVASQGYTVSAPPTRDTWLDQYYSHESYWDPYVQANPDTDGLDRLYEACPHDAPDLYPPIAQTQ